MEQYIPKAAVVAEIDSMLKSVEHTSHCDEISFNSGRWKALTSIKEFINALEVKEVGVDVGSTEGDVCVKTIWDGDKIVSNKPQKGE